MNIGFACVVVFHVKHKRKKAALASGLFAISMGTYILTL